jgi:hypothetical protein
MKGMYIAAKLLTIVIGLTAVFLWSSWPVREVKAIQDSEDFPAPFGLARGQTARLTLFNVGETAVVGPEYKFLNGHGVVLARSIEEIVIPAGQFRYFDFDLPNPPPGTVDLFGRMQIRAVVNAVGNPDIKNVRVSVEVFDNDTGKTTLILQPPPIPD